MAKRYAYVHTRSTIELYHHGIKRQQWGVRNGPPYPLKGGDYSQLEYEALKRERRRPNSSYNKKHYDAVIKERTTLSTLSYDKDRTSKGDMFYATYKPLDKHQYNALFNRPVTDINTGEVVNKYRISNIAKSDIHVASEDSGSNVFSELFRRDRDFYNFITDTDRMQSLFVEDKYKFKGYREAREALNKIRSGRDVNSDDLKCAYRMFNYVLPSDAGGNKRQADDIRRQRNKFFNALKQRGYGAVLDTNDALYGAFKASAPVIVFDMERIALSGAERTTTRSKRFSTVVTVGRRFLGV